MPVGPNIPSLSKRFYQPPVTKKADTATVIGEPSVEFIADNARDVWNWRPSWP